MLKILDTLMLKTTSYASFAKQRKPSYDTNSVAKLPEKIKSAKFFPSAIRE